jgi:DNA-3-methyladenine glycosylase
MDPLTNSVDFAWLDAPAADVVTTARGLLGWTLAANGVRVRLTEVEAYLGGGLDGASHANRGRTPRNSVMFGPAGVAYVYQIYGVHYCVNVVCGQVGEAAAVLLRAGEVIDGSETARQRRPTARADRDLARGPGCLVRALGLGPADNGSSLVTGPARLLPPTEKVGDIEAGPRVGVASAHDYPWRFWLKGEPSVSAYKRHTPKKRSIERHMSKTSTGAEATPRGRVR